MATVRESWEWTDTVPTNVTVMALPVHGFTSGNTSSIGNSVGRSAAAGAANARANRPSRIGRSLFTAVPPLPPQVRGLRRIMTSTGATDNSPAAPVECPLLAEPAVIHGVAPSQAPALGRWALHLGRGPGAARTALRRLTRNQRRHQGRLTHPLVDFLTVRIQGITVEVSDLSVSKDFYENVLGFQPGEIAEPLAPTPYGTYKFVIKDPDGYRLGFVRARQQ